MFRIDTATAAATLPAPAAAGTPGYFTGGNPTTGVPPTSITPDWLNATQEEILAVITAASIAESKTANNQLLTALQALFVSSSGLGGSLSTNGYAKLPGGLIIQWGVTASYSAEGSKSITFPIAFPNAIFVGGATPDLPAASSAQDAFAQVFGKSTTGMSIYMQYPSSGSTTWGMTADWFAFGY